MCSLEFIELSWFRRDETVTTRYSINFFFCSAHFESEEKDKEPKKRKRKTKMYAKEFKALNSLIYFKTNGLQSNENTMWIDLNVWALFHLNFMSLLAKKISCEINFLVFFRFLVCPSHHHHHHTLLKCVRKKNQRGDVLTVCFLFSPPLIRFYFLWIYLNMSCCIEFTRLIVSFHSHSIHLSLIENYI